MDLRILTFLLIWCHKASPHGRLIEPISRASAWRKGFPVIANYDDNGLNCGGVGRQMRNGGRCGTCGDPYDLPKPRPHEIGGKYGSGIIVAEYLTNSLIEIHIDLTTFHKGYWELKICPTPYGDQKCFEHFVLKTADGKAKFFPFGTGSYVVLYQLPKGLSCNHCVVQWRYTTGNNWGWCRNGLGKQGCGNQENFVACADVRIVSKSDKIQFDY